MTTEKLSAVMSSVERVGGWTVPERLEARIMWGSAQLDFRSAKLSPGTTVIDVRMTMANLEIILPPELAIDVAVDSVMANVEVKHVNPPEDPEPEGQPFRVAPAVARRRIRLVGRTRMSNIEVSTLGHGETVDDARHRDRHRRRHNHEEHRRHWRALHAEKEMWRDARRHGRGPEAWMPWWLMSRMRRRIFFMMAVAMGIGGFVGFELTDGLRWWHLVLTFFVLGAASGGIAWRMTRPLIMVVKAARDIGDGKLDTRIDVHHHGGEMKLLATAINDMASKIEQQLKDQRTLLAAVSHELRTPLGHMRVLVETARDTSSPAALAELDREILVLDDLVGRLLASSRLEFGNLERRMTNLGELVTDVATSAGIAPEAIEAIGLVDVAVDATLIRRATANLIGNAKIHGGGAIAIRIERRGAQVVIEVDDAGPGVPPDRRADAFRAFVPSSAGGLGLGLALVSRIAVAHDGGAWIAERPGGGARVGFAVRV